MSNEVYDRLRPGAFAKNIPYLDDSMRKELFRKGVKWCQAYLIQLAKIAGSDAETEYESVIMRECQAKYGAQLFIDKKLSDEMMDVDLRDITREDIVFPFNSMEFYFEDPQIPTFIFQKHSEEEARRDWNIAYAGLGGTALGDGFRMCFFGGPYTFTNIYPMEAIREFLEYRNIFRKDGRNCLDDSDFEKRLRRFLFLMAVKILLYISIPKYKAVPVTRNQIPHGKPGVKNRPNRPIFRAI